MAINLLSKIIAFMSGQVVFGEDYFTREQEEAKVWRYLDRAANIILLAPRRAGKTSMLRQLEKSPKPGYVFLYVMVQSCSSEHQFYKQVFEKLYDSDFVGNLEKVSKRAGKLLKKALGNIDKITIGDKGIELKNVDHQITWLDLADVIRKLDLPQKLVIVFDEYPDVLEKINYKQGLEASSQFLTNMRTLCQDVSLGQRVQFIFTGSIGLDSLAHRLNLSNLINDRDKLTLAPLNEEQAEQFLDFLIHRNKSDMFLQRPVKRYCLAKVEWLMPYYLEILWERLEDHCMDNQITAPTNEDVDKAYELLFSQTYRSYFNHWVERLKRLERGEQLLAKAILGLMAKQGHIKLSEYLNLCEDEQFVGVAHNYVFDCLEHDGYLFASQPKIYQFTSPILREWWNRYADRTL